MKAVHIIASVVLLSVAVGGMVIYKVMDDAALTAATDSANIDHTVNIGVDNWAGYSILCSAEMRRIALDRRVLVKCHDDQANYGSRMSKLKSGDLEMAVATVDGYVLAGVDEDYPASIAFVIDESQGGDVIVANRTIAENTDDLKGKTGLRITFTPDSPSQTLVTAWSTHFDVPINDSSKFTVVPANGSSDAAQKLLSGQADVAVLWEPDASRVLENGNVVKLLGSESTKNLIVDVLLVNQRYATNNPEVVKIISDSYFVALEYYKARPDEFNEAIASYTNVIDDDKIETLKQGIKWIDLPHNAIEWLGISHNNVIARRGLYDAIDSSVRLYMDSGDLTSNPLPGGDPFRLINSTAFADTFERGMAGNLGVLFQALTKVTDTSVTREFKKMSPGRWAKLRDVGSLRLQPITFSRGTAELNPTDQDAFRNLVEMLETYPHYRIKVVGHTGWSRRESDTVKAANMDLSKARALRAADYLMDKYGIHKNRIYTLGLGSTEPPIREAGESNRSWYAKWPRVELILVEGEY